MSPRGANSPSPRGKKWGWLLVENIKGWGMQEEGRKEEGKGRLTAIVA